MWFGHCDPMQNLGYYKKVALIVSMCRVRKWDRFYVVLTTNKIGKTQCIFGEDIIGWLLGNIVKDPIFYT